MTREAILFPARQDGDGTAGRALFDYPTGFLSGNLS
jgi:hypothetical protein